MWVGAALAIDGGETLSSFFGCLFGKNTNEDLLAQVQASASAVKRLQAVHTLVIDEVSTLGGATFETIAFLLRGVRSSSNLVGGVRMILCGDPLKVSRH